MEHLILARPRKGTTATIAAKKPMLKIIGISLCLAIALGTTIFSIPFAHADSTDIVINEIHYNPGSGNQLDEFLELHNTSSDTIDLANWCFTAGITLCFANGFSIGPNEYAIITPNGSDPLVNLGIAPLALYTGALSNGGETITLRDAGNTIVDTFTYVDSSPWPAASDGSGPSLELNDPLIDNSLATSWRASQVDGGTPGEENSFASVDLPTVSNVSQHTDVEDTESVVITATVSNAVTINLDYKINFDDDITIPMVDDGTGVDVTSGDSIYSAEIPAQSAGDLVRYKVVGTNLDGSSYGPSTDDSIEYFGYVPNSQTSEGENPILQWFISDADYDSLVNNPDQDDTYFTCVFVYGNQVFDNSQIRLNCQKVTILIFLKF